MIGQTISHYKIFERLGEGGMGVVYKAQDTKLKRIVALKFLPPSLTADEASKERFIHEARAASTLDHPNICTVHEVDETEDGQMFIAMAYYAGETLKKKIERGSLHINAAVDIASQVAEGLAKAHQQGIVHRDIKPANILITEEGQAKIVDFGLAKLAGQTKMTKTGSTVGTVIYMSPEQARGEAVDHRTDIWSLGVVFYEMLTGQLPFQGDYEHAILYLIINESPASIRKLNAALSPDLEEVVNRALKKDPESRFPSVVELLNDLKKYKESLRAEELGVFLPRILIRRLRRPWVAVPAVLALLVIILATTWLFDRQTKIRWAKEEALPEIERLIEAGWRDFTDAYTLAEEAEQYIPEDPKLAELFSLCSFRINVKTEPPGANVSFKHYSTPESEWKSLGVSPLEGIRVPHGIFRWKIEKEDFETVMAMSSTWGFRRGEESFRQPNDFVRVLDKKGSIPPGMVRVQGERTDLGELADFYIDRHEVTNKQYREFVDGGGYRKQEFWKHKFIKDGKVLSWSDAMKAFVDQTGRPGPSTWQAGDFREGQDEYPVSGISWYEAAAYAEFAGKTLPTVYHWGIARGEYTTLIRIPQLGGYAVIAPFSNFTGNGPVPVGSFPGVTSYGVYDMAGNVREWCWNETEKGRVLRGGAWNDPPYMFSAWSQAPPLDRSSKNGLRCAIYPNPRKIPEAAFATATFRETRDYSKDKPAPDPIFQVYKEQFSYDKTELHPRVEWKDGTSDNWTKEKITFNAAYGGERMIAYLFLPKNATPPYQTVIYFPGSNAKFYESSDDMEKFVEFPVFVSFLVKNGRAVLIPVYKGTFERRDDALAHADEKSHLYTEYLIKLVKDFRRSVDYVETRQDIDLSKLAYYGMSWGAALGAIIPAVEERLKANIILSGGLAPRGRPEANQINYVTRVKIPTLMLNGKYDSLIPYETSVKPMFDLLGTPDEHKELKLYETDHIPPRNEFIKEILAWLDRYLGPVK